MPIIDFCYQAIELDDEMEIGSCNIGAGLPRIDVAFVVSDGDAKSSARARKLIENLQQRGAFIFGIFEMRHTDIGSLPRCDCVIPVRDLSRRMPGLIEFFTFIGRVLYIPGMIDLDFSDFRSVFSGGILSAFRAVNAEDLDFMVVAIDRYLARKNYREVSALMAVSVCRHTTLTMIDDYADRLCGSGRDKRFRNFAIYSPADEYESEDSVPCCVPYRVRVALVRSCCDPARYERGRGNRAHPARMRNRSRRREWGQVSSR